MRLRGVYNRRNLIKKYSGKSEVKELDAETGLYYYGARYLDPRTSRWLSGDPAIYQGDYLPSAPINDEARRRNANLPGMGGIFNYVNMHVYHYGGNNPVKYVDPDGKAIVLPAIIKKLIIDAGRGALVGSATAFATRYVILSFARLLEGESLESAFTIRGSDWAGYRRTMLRGAGNGALSGLLSNVPGLGRLARTGSTGSGLSTAFINMFSTATTTIAQNIIEGRDITENLLFNLIVSGSTGFLTGIITPQGTDIASIEAFHPITSNPYITNQYIHVSVEGALRAKIAEMFGGATLEAITLLYQYLND